MRSCMTLAATGREIPIWDKPYWQMSALLARRHYGPLTLFADLKSAARLVDEWEIPFDEVNTTLIPRETRGCHPMVWSAGKLVAMREMAARGQPFFHIDGDAFVFHRLKPEIESSRMFVQCVETGVKKRTAVYRRNTQYPINELLPDMQLPSFMARYARLPVQAVMNMGIFGGNDCGAIYEYADLAIKTFVQNRRNTQVFFRFHRTRPHFLGLACMAEQWALGAYCFWKNITPAALMNRIDSFNINRAHEVGGFIHLFTCVRRNPAFRKWAKHRLKRLLAEETLKAAA